MNNPFEYTPGKDSERAFRHLIERLEKLRGSALREDEILCREMEAGKMLGVLIATDGYGALHTLYAFSGQAGELGFHHPDFVGPIFDYLNPDGYFKTREREITRQNVAVAAYESGPLAQVREEYAQAEARLRSEVEAFRNECRKAKEERKLRRQSGEVTADEEAAMIRRSQFEKAELHRMKRRVTEALAPLTAKVRAAEAYLDDMREKRRADSEALQEWLFDNFLLLNARGESRSLRVIFAETPMGVPPSGAGECCAPKLLHAAYTRGWRPVEIAEYWYGRSKGGEVRIHGTHYPACRGKCLPVLSWMLQGLDVVPPVACGSHVNHDLTPRLVYENTWFCVVAKPRGILSVPGKHNAPSVQSWLEERYGKERQVKVAHRLDQDTSGLLVATFGPEAYRTMQSLFATRRVRKTYMAVLEGDYTAKELSRRGRLELPLAPDWLDRPRQKVDTVTGKEAVTEYEFTGTENGRSHIVFHPLTGRTHQLRVHAAAGLGMPIVGDPLYGNRHSLNDTRLYLHACRLEFTFPPDGKTYVFKDPVPW